MAKALKLIGHPGCDFAIVDVTLGLENSEPVVLVLKTRNIPFVILSGNSREHLPTGFAGAPLLSKPVDPVKLLALVKAT